MIFLLVHYFKKDLYSLSIAAGTNYQKFSGSKNVNLSYSSGDGLIGLKSRFQQGQFFLKFLGGEYISLPSAAFRGYLQSLAHGPISAVTSLRPRLLSPSLTVTFLPLSFSYKDPCDYIGPTRIIQENLSISRPLT